MGTVSLTEGHPPPPPRTDGIRSVMVTPFSSRNFWSQKQRRILRLIKWSVVRGTPINTGLMVPLRITAA